MNSAIRWAVIRDRYPFGIGDVLGHVQAPDRAAALTLAACQFDGKIVVQSVASLKVSLLEPQPPASDELRDDVGLKKRGCQSERMKAYRRSSKYRDYQAERRAAHARRGSLPLTNQNGDAL